MLQLNLLLVFMPNIAWCNNLHYKLNRYRPTTYDTGWSDSNRFRVVWNAPTEQCHTTYGYNFNWEKYGIEVNTKQGWVGKVITIFTPKQLGMYPYFDDQGKAIYGGLPQAVDIQDHLAKSSRDITSFIPNVNYTGLAVIDWEAWRPIWDRNWDTKKIYQTKSEERVEELHPSWNQSQIVAQAKKEFTLAARNMMEKTLLLGRKMRPGGTWGFYEFPECYNARLGQKTCDAKARAQNDKLDWLFEAASALYPSAYLSKSWNITHKTGFVHGQIQEALRVAAVGSPPPRPVFMYSRYQYRPLYPLYTKNDLLVTIKQAADFGIAAVVLWGDHYSEINQSVCETMVDYVHTTLGPTVEKILNRTSSCERLYCPSSGRCVLRNILTAPQWTQFESLANFVWADTLNHTSKDTLQGFYAKFYKCVTSVA